jgi:hypothetical protein
MSVSLDRLVRNQLVFREVNDRIRELMDQFGIVDPADFVCECSNETCAETVMLDRDEYRAIRASPSLFVIVPGHETTAVEQVIDTNERFMLVEKVKHVDKVIESHRAPEGG